MTIFVLKVQFIFIFLVYFYVYFCFSLIFSVGNNFFYTQVNDTSNILCNIHSKINHPQRIHPERPPSFKAGI